MTDDNHTPSTMSETMLSDQLGRAVDSFTSEDQVVWSIFGAFWGANTVLLVALFATGKLPESPFVGIVVSIVGAALSFTWQAIQKRAIQHLERYELLIETLEKKLLIPRDCAISVRINEKDYRDKITGPKGYARMLMRGCGRIAAILWGIGVLYFVTAVLCK